MANENKAKYNVELGIGEFHLVFGALQDKFLVNKTELESLVSYENVYDQVIADQEKYDRLIEQNRQLDMLSDRLYKTTGAQLNVGSGY